MAAYIAVIRQGAAAYAASFPDFPGLAVDGQTLDELLAKASDVLAAHVQSLLEAGKAIGDPTPVEAIERGDALLLAAVEIPDDLGLAKVPHYSTLCYAAQRLLKKGRSFASSWGPPRPQPTAA